MIQRAPIAQAPLPKEQPRMPRQQKSIDEQLTEAKARQDQLKARLHMLEVKKRQRDSRTRAKAEMTLTRVVVDQMTAQPGFKNVIAELVKVTPLRPDELEAINWLMASLDPAKPARPIVFVANANPSAGDSGTAPAPDLKQALKA